MRQRVEIQTKVPSISAGLIEAADNELDAIRLEANRYRVLREHWLRIDSGATVHRTLGLDLWCDKRLSESKDQSPK
jgi:hypothetical protein